MKVLVGCEYSGRVRDAFLLRGHDAMSCDLLDTESPGPHYKGDVRDVLGDGWDLVILHPDCTYLTRAGQRWLNAPDDNRPGKLKGRPRALATARAVGFFAELIQADIPRRAVENPRPGSHVAHLIGSPDQYVHPYEHGTRETKATGLWLHNLPPLVPTVADVDAERRATLALPPAQRSPIHYASPGPNRWKMRSLTYPGIAAAMADQWGSLGALPKPAGDSFPEVLDVNPKRVHG